MNSIKRLLIFVILTNFLQICVVKTENITLNKEQKLNVIVPENLLQTSNVILFENITLNAYSMTTINVQNLNIIRNYDKKFGYGLLQVHSYGENFTLSLKTQLINNEQYYQNGTNLGFILFQDQQLYVFNYNYYKSISVLIALILYDDQTPIPGGCTLEGQIDILPIIITNQIHDNMMIQVDTQGAALSAQYKDLTKYCALKTNNLTYETRYKLLTKNKLTPKTYFDAIKLMLYYDGVIDNSDVSTKTPGPLLRRLYNTLSDVIIFTTIVKYQNKSSVYVPAVTIENCSSNLYKIFNCSYYDDIGLIILAFCLFCFGLIKCFFGLQNNQRKLIINGFEFGGFLIWIFNLLLIYFSFKDGKIILIILFGLFFAIIWCNSIDKIKREYNLLIDIFLKLILGYITACYCFYFTGNLDFLASNINYWITFTTIISVTMAILVLFFNVGIIITSVLLGSYYSSIGLQYICRNDLFNAFFNNFKRIAIKNFNYATDNHDIHLYEILHITFFLTLFSVSLSYQMYFYLKNKQRIYNESVNIQNYHQGPFITRWINESESDDVFESPNTSYRFFRQFSRREHRYEEI